jgi:hypothetical protein
VRKLAEQYNLTPDEVRTIMEALDYASGDIEKVMASMRKAAKAEAKVTLEAQDAASAVIGGVLDMMSLFRDKTVTLRTVKTGANAGTSPGGTGPTKNGYTGMRIPAGYADGGQPGFSGRVPGTPPADPTKDNVLAVTQNGNPIAVRSREWIINEKASDKHDLLLRAINSGVDISRFITGYATGGRPSDAEVRYDKFKELEKSSKLDLARQKQQILNIEKSLRATETVGKGKALRGYDRDVAELELAAAKAELAQMKADNRTLKTSYGSPAAEKARYEDAQARDEQASRDAEEAENAAIARAQKVTSATDSVRDKVDIGGLTSPAAVDRYVSRMLVDITGFTNVLGRLKAKGAAPWLLDQMVKMGPSKSVIRLGERYLADDAALASINAKAGLLDQVSGTYGRMVSDERFMAAGSYAPEGVSREVSVQIQALDVTKVTAEIQRVLRHELTTMGAGANLT